MAFVAQTGAFLTAIGVCAAAGWWALEPRVMASLNSILDSRDEAVVEAMIAEINARWPIEQPVLIEFGGTGAQLVPGEIKSGGVVEFLFFLRRNDDCRTDILVQFWSYESKRIEPRYSYTIPTQQAPASFDMIEFLIEVQIPDSMPPGVYSYMPIILPDQTECPQFDRLHVPPSPFFEVLP